MSGRRAGSLTWGAWFAVVVLVALLGVRGFAVYDAQRGISTHALTRAYLVAQLFTLESGAVRGAVPWQLDVARVAAPMAAAYALLRVLAELLAAQADRWRIRRLHDHVVVVGLDECGTALCRDLVDRGRQVVAVDRTVDAAAAEALRAHGVHVLRADPARADALRASRLERASHLVVRARDDGATAQVVALAESLTRTERAATSRRPALACVGVLTSPDLWHLLTARTLWDETNDAVRVDFVDLEGTALLLALRDHPPRDDAGTGAPAAARVLVTGNGRIAVRLVSTLARTSAADTPTAPPLRVSLDGIGQKRLARLRRAHPEWAALELEVAPVGGLADRDCGVPLVAYVCDGPVTDVVDRVVALRRHVPPGSRVVVVRGSVEPVTRLLAAGGPHEGAPVVVLGLTEPRWLVDVLLGGTAELLARALHEQYVARRREQAPDHGGDPARLPWVQLPESLRESNRAQARDLVVKLRAVRRLVGPLVDPTPPRFTAAEVEVLARLEHDRWTAERRAQGWRPGPRDVEARTTPYLVPWEELAEDVRDLDRLFVEALPQVLASVGLQLRPAAETVREAARLPGR
ncbi:NAD-binding protein [Cellulomonas cellasea]|uniref:Voltage-gated potassium channel Kch n=1 Tax=Cellulomonas cellasea TaxID=43670 RepID=A0A7W4YCV2_9CELL|nr:NAD-binding protein [Cellulomonas cellasea]MBB2925390.1 voltage-gated potassium channel Kch [Cellulomonas cellasea]